MSLPDLPPFWPHPCPSCGAPHDPAGGLLGPISDALLCGDCAVRRDAILEHERMHPAHREEER